MRDADSRKKDKVGPLVKINKIKDPSIWNEMIDKARDDLNFAALEEYLETGTLTSQYIWEKSTKFEEMLTKSHLAEMKKTAEEKIRKK